MSTCCWKRNGLAVALIGVALSGCDRLQVGGSDPEITAVAPAEVEPGQTVVVQGAGFSTALHENVVLFGNKSGRVVTAVPTELKVEVPALGLAEASTARVAVRVRVGGRESNPLILDVRAEPVIAEADPDAETEAGDASSPAERDLADASPEAEVPRSAPAPKPEPRTARAEPAPAARATPVPEPVTRAPEPTRPAATPAPRPKLKPTPKPPPVPAPKPAGSAAAAPSRSFVTGPTRLLSPSKGSGGPAGFDVVGVEVVDEEKRARFDVTLSPAVLRPGQPYQARVSITNLGEDKIRVDSLRAIWIVDGRRSSKAIALRSKQVSPGETEFLADLPGVWPDQVGSWALELVARSRNDEYQAQVDWR